MHLSKRRLLILFLVVTVLLIFVFFTFLLFFKNVFFAPVSVIPQNLVEIEVADTVGAVGDRWIRTGIPLPEGNGLDNAINVRVLQYNPVTSQYTEVYSDVWTQTMRPLQNELWWIGLTFKAENLQPGEERIYYVDYGFSVVRSDPPQSLVITGGTGNYYSVNTGNGHIFELNQQGYDIFRRVSVNGQDIIAPNSLGGLEIKDSAGIIYSTRNDVPTIVIEESGNVHAVFRIEGFFRDALGNPFVGYVARMIIYNDGKVELPFVIQNKGPIDRNVNGNHKRFKDFSAVLNLNMASQKNLMLTEFVSPIAYTTESYTAYQDFNFINNDFDALTAGQDPTPGNMIDNFYVRVVGPSEATLYFQQNEPETQSGTRSDGLIAISDGTKKFSLSVFDFWKQSPKMLKVQGNSVRIGLLPEDSSQNYLVHDQGPILKTYASNPARYDHLTYSSSSVYNQHAAIDEGNYIIHTATQAYEKLIFDFSSGVLIDTNEIQFARGAQEQIVGLAQPSYYRTSKAFANKFRYVEDLDWSQYGFSQPLVDAGNKLDSWGKALWDENYATNPPFSGYPYQKFTFLNRLKMGTSLSGEFGIPHYGWLYNGQLFWQGEGWMNNGFGTVTGFMAVLMRTRDHRAWSLFSNIVLHNSLDAVYVWNTPDDNGAGATRHEKGQPVLGFFQDSNSINSPRHQWEDGIAWAKLITADDMIKESILYSAVDFASGYPFGPVGTAGRKIEVPMSNTEDLISPIGPQLLNLVSYYQLTGDPTYVNVAKEYLKAFKVIMEKCEASFGVKIIVSPSQNQFVLPSGLTSTNGVAGTYTNQYNCANPSNNNIIQAFTTSYTLISAIEILEADKQITGQYDTALKDFFIDAFDDYYTYLVEPYINPVEPAIGTPYSPPYLYNYFHIKVVGAPPPSSATYGSCVGPNALPDPDYVIYLCSRGEVGATEMFGGVILPWLSYQTNDFSYLNYASVLVKSLLLYRGGPPSPLYGVPSSYSYVAWRHPGLGLADVKLAIPWLWRFLPFWGVKSGVISNELFVNVDCSTLGGIECATNQVCTVPTQPALGTSACCVPASSCIADVIPPNIVGSISPNFPLYISTASFTLQFTNNEQSSCRYDTSANGANLDYNSMNSANSFTTSNGLFHQKVFSSYNSITFPLSLSSYPSGLSMEFYISCVDDPAPGNVMSPSVLHTVVINGPDTTPPQIFVSSVLPQSDSVSFVWTTDELATTEASAQSGIGLPVITQDPMLTILHSITLNGLLPSTVYSYTITSSDFDQNSDTETGNFITSPDAVSLSFNVLASTPGDAGMAVIFQEGWKQHYHAPGCAVGYSGSFDTRCLLYFDLSSVPNSIINLAANLHLEIGSVSPSGTQTKNVDIYPLTQIFGYSSWPPAGNGGSNGGNNGGTAAANGQADWIHALHSATSWAIPGGDYNSNQVVSQSFSTAVGNPVDVDVTSLVLPWISNSLQNYGMLLTSAGTPNVGFEVGAWGDSVPTLTITGQTVSPSSCVASGAVACNTEQPGNCAAGTQTCVGGQWSLCAPISSSCGGAVPQPPYGFQANVV